MCQLEERVKSLEEKVNRLTEIINDMKRMFYRPSCA